MNQEILDKILKYVIKGLKCAMKNLKKAYDKMDKETKKKFWASIILILTAGVGGKALDKRNNDNAVNNEHKAINIDMENMDKELEKIIHENEEKLSYKEMVLWYDERINKFRQQISEKNNFNEDELKAYSNLIHFLEHKKEVYIKSKR